jgi:hypothetical protein
MPTAIGGEQARSGDHRTGPTRKHEMSGLVPDLRKMIDDFQNAMFPKIPKPVLEPLMRGVDDLVLAGIDRAALRVGDHAPDFALPDANGNSVRLSSLLASGPAVLSFYRGVW